MIQTKVPKTRRFVGWLGSGAAFRLILALLVVQAAWIALSGRYPMAFDEDFHLGIIRLYAHHLSPFWGNQAPGDGKFGAVAHDPSYLYQYLMSFPYRLITRFTQDQTIQVLWLRAINIGLFTWGVMLYRRLMLKAKASGALVNACLLVFVLIPVVPLLAAQINYDNLFLPVTALALFLTLRFDGYLVKQKRLDLKSGLQLLIVCLLGSLVKYAFLPIFVAIVVFVLVRIWQRRHSLRRSYLTAGWHQMGRGLQVGLVLGLIVSGGMFAERYGVNLVRYHTPVPDCSHVLTIKQCSQYGPWIRNYDDKINRVDNDILPGSAPTFTADWFYGMWLRLFFAVDGPGTDFQTRGPFIIPALGAIAFAVAGTVVVLVSLQRFKKYNNPVTWLFAAALGGYVAALWLDDYQAFLETGQPVAINGRYLLPVLPLAFLAVAVAANEVFKRTSAKLVIGTLAVVCLAWGGGALTYILRSNDAWYWPNPAVRDVNRAVQQVVGPLVPGYRHPTQFLH